MVARLTGDMRLNPLLDRFGSGQDAVRLQLDVSEPLFATWSACVSTCGIQMAVQFPHQHSRMCENSYGRHKKRGSYDGLYAAGLYRQDRGRLLRRLR